MSYQRADILAAFANDTHHLYRQEHGEKVSNRQVGYGLVFGVPKSLSIYLAVTRD